MTRQVEGGDVLHFALVRSSVAVPGRASVLCRAATSTGVNYAAGLETRQGEEALVSRGRPDPSGTE